ncbi:MAG: hypothetical protein WBA57_04535 [Elainellaceae cyanobacterium]
MKIVEQSTYRLTLRLRPWVIWSFSAMFIGCGLLPIALTSKQELTCDRAPAPGQCELQGQKLFGNATLKTFQLPQIQRAVLESSRDSDGDPTYRVVLLTEAGKVPFMSEYQSGRSRHQDNADKINAFLQNSEQLSLYVEHDDRWSYLLVLLISSGTGLILLLLMGQVVICDLDRQSDTLLITRRGLLGTKILEHPLGKISGVVVQASPGVDGGGTYRICFILASDEEVPVTAYYSVGRKDKWQTVELIRQFLPALEAE